MWELKVGCVMVSDKQQKVEIYIMNSMIVFRLLSDPAFVQLVNTDYKPAYNS